MMIMKNSMGPNIKIKIAIKSQMIKEKIIKNKLLLLREIKTMINISKKSSKIMKIKNRNKFTKNLQLMKKKILSLKKIMMKKLLKKLKNKK
jgi:hypothetical protein